ncbi:protein GRAVITROPIC IN THE LIGHT 1-like isoform X2 [Phragmites australis]|uniref:protein GRAVITROPIC IN THE LIGHT 1-like isoform X2 n=1 Tax=Phragmites australis TaxID=29695 RepID=UPI002D786266|nr:protein GRAVITROPIC IN THE LIGHT 1-like isoform X2 [Phragmites australis]
MPLQLQNVLSGKGNCLQHSAANPAFYAHLISPRQSLGQMESPRATRTARTPTCTVPGLLVGLTKLCKLTKVCAAPALDNNEATTKPGLRYCGGYDQRLVLIRLFEGTAALKSAYIKLQRAHIPYSPAKIAFADDIITSELESVTALQCLCSSASGSVGPLVNERWSLLQELEAEMRKRDSDIVLLKRELEGLQRGNARLNKQIKSKQPAKHYDKVFSVPKELIPTTPSALLKLFKVASTSVQDFAGLIASQLLSSDHCISNADVAEQLWKRYSLEAHLSRTMFGGGSGTGTAGGEEGFDIDAARFDRIMGFCDPLDALMQHPSSSFSRFCRTKYLAAVPPEMETAVFRNLDHRTFVSRGGHPRTWFYRAFATTARSAWALHVVMARCSGAQSVRMFYARRGSEYVEEYMESVAEPVFGRRGSHGEEKLSVALTVTPGVKIGDTVVACRVFLCDPQDANNIQ